MRTRLPGSAGIATTCRRGHLDSAADAMTTMPTSSASSSETTTKSGGTGDAYRRPLAQWITTMPSYILRTIDPDLWARAKARAAADQIPMRQVILALLRLYADEQIRVRAEVRVQTTGP
jgi:hypothetical protein